MVVVTQLTQTCESCPSQWEGLTRDGQHVYVRYRGGWLAVGVGESLEDAVAAAVSLRNRTPVLLRQLGDRYDGTLTYERLRTMGRSLIDWP